jgi:hypothetical protein
MLSQRPYGERLVKPPGHDILAESHPEHSSRSDSAGSFVIHKRQLVASKFRLHVVLADSSKAHRSWPASDGDFIVHNYSLMASMIVVGNVYSRKWTPKGIWQPFWLYCKLLLINSVLTLMKIIEERL